MDLALILWAHLAGDYLMQTHEVSQRKPHSPRHMAIHITTYHLPMGAVALLIFWGSPLATSVFLAVSILSHTFLDLRWPVLGLMRLSGSGEFATWSNGAGLMIFDQFAHYTFLLAGYALALPLL